MPVIRPLWIGCCGITTGTSKSSAPASFHASQKELEKRFGVTQSAISRRIKSILCKLRNEMGE